MIISDNGPQYDCQSYKQFSKEWGFQHITSSPRYPKSNGFIERQVQTVKNTLTKAEKSGKDLSMAMLCLRSTPIDSQLPSPAELLYQRKLKSNLPLRIKNQMPNRDQISQRLIERQQSMKYYHDRNAHDLSPLATGQHVRTQDQRTKKWFPGIVSYKRPEPRSYEVQTQYGSTLHRNRCHLRPAAAQHSEMGPTDENTISEPRPSVPEFTEALHTTPTPSLLSDVTAASVSPTHASMDTNLSNANQSPEPFRTKCGRAVIKPAHFAE